MEHLPYVVFLPTFLELLACHGKGDIEVLDL